MMIRFVAGVISALLLVGAAIFWWKSTARAGDPVPAFPAAVGASVASGQPFDPPAADEKTREEKRFSRYDKDKNGAVSREEYLASRRKAFARLDTNGDGRLSFEEWAAKSIGKFNTADADHSATLTPAEFATTRVARKPRVRPDCPPVRPSEPAANESDD